LALSRNEAGKDRLIANVLVRLLDQDPWNFLEAGLATERAEIWVVLDPAISVPTVAHLPLELGLALVRHLLELSLPLGI